MSDFVFIIENVYPVRQLPVGSTYSHHSREYYNEQSRVCWVKTAEVYQGNDRLVACRDAKDLSDDPYPRNTQINDLVYLVKLPVPKLPKLGRWTDL